ncbi:MAG TPA: MBG domain-containing protein, partial [Luteolibacter sp.]
FSINNGAWFDVEASGSGAAFASNGYNAVINTNGKPGSGNEFDGQNAWSGNSNGWLETIVNLTDTAKYAGKNLRIRWRIATDSGTASTGWYVDSIALLGGGNLANQAPVIAAAATSSSTETVTDPDSTVYQIIRGPSTNLSVIATDDGGESALKYTWSVQSGPGSPVFFPVNANNAAKSTTASFEAAGDYQISVSVLDAQGLATTSSVNLRVLQSAADLIVSPAVTTVTFGGTRSFGASLLDQFGAPMASQPSSFSWSASGGGTIDASGVFTASAVGGPYVIGAGSGGFSNTASVTVTPASATISLGSLNQTYDGSSKSVTVTTNPPGLAVAVTYNGSSVGPGNAGSYVVEANITNPNYQGSASGTLVISKATATVSLDGLACHYDG